MFYLILVLLHVIASFLLVVVILLQSSKGGGLAGTTFGGGSSMSFLGARGTANFLSRATTVLAVIFMLNSLGLSLIVRGIGKPVSVTQQQMQSGASNLPHVGAGTESGAPGTPITSPGEAPAPGTPTPTAPEGGGTPPGQTSKPQL